MLRSGVSPPVPAALLSVLSLLATGCSYDAEAEFARANQPTGRARVHGFVRLPDGTPAADVRVWGLTNRDTLNVDIRQHKFVGTMQSHESARKGSLRAIEQAGVLTDEAGEFLLEVPDVRAVVVCDEGGFAEVPVEREVDPLQVTLQPWARIEGTLQIGSAPGSEEFVMAVRMNGPGGMYRWLSHVTTFVLTDEQGRFVLERVPPGDIHVARAIRHNPAGGTWLDVKPGSTQQVTIGGDGRRVIGRIVLPEPLAEEVEWTAVHALLSQRPKPGQKVDHHGLHVESFSAMVEMDEEGRFRVDDAPAGRYTLNAWLTPTPVRTSTSATPPPTVSFVPVEFTVPPFAAADRDNPLDVGDLRLKPNP